MSQVSSDTATGDRAATAFFDSRDAAEAARRDLTEAGFAPELIALAGDGTPTDAPILPEEGGFWHALKEFFIPDQDRYTFAEGIRRGGFVVSVRTDAAGYDRALDILDADGAVDIDERERRWQAEGWTGWEDGMDPIATTPHRPDNSTAGFGASLAGEDGYQAPPSHLAADDASSASSLDDTVARGDTTRVGTGVGGEATLNPDLRERIGAGTASMTARTASGSPSDAQRGNAADFDRKAAIEDASLGSPTRSGAETPRSSSTIGSTNEDQADSADAWTARRDLGITRSRVRGTIIEPGQS